MSEGNEKTYQAVMLDVSEEDLPRVLEAIQRAMDDCEEVQGFASGSGAWGGMSGTNCKVTGGTLNPSDFSCTDGQCTPRIV